MQPNIESTALPCAVVPVRMWGSWGRFGWWAGARGTRGWRRHGLCHASGQQRGTGILSSKPRTLAFDEHSPSLPAAHQRPESQAEVLHCRVAKQRKRNGAEWVRWLRIQTPCWKDYDLPMWLNQCWLVLVLCWCMFQMNRRQQGTTWIIKSWNVLGWKGH